MMHKKLILTLGIVSALTLSARAWAGWVGDAQSSSAIAESSQAAVSPNPVAPTVEATGNGTESKEEEKLLELSGDIKMRGEARRDASFGTTPDAREDFVGQLLRIKLAGTYSDVNYVVHLMDGRDWGSERKTGTSESVNMLEGYLSYGRGYDLRIGRQEITLGEKRLIGSSGWAYDYLPSYDGIRFQTKVQKGDIDLFAVKVAEGAKAESDDANLLGASYTWDRSERWSPGVYLLFNHQQDTDGEDTRMPIAGTIGSLDLISGLVADYELIHQWGTRRGVDHSGDLIHVGFTYTQPDTKRYWLAIEYNIASGDEDPNDGENNTFDKLYSINHGHYGYIDYQDPQNMRNLRLTVGGRVAGPVALQADYHTFRLDEARDRWYSGDATASLHDPTSQSGTDVGSEVDLTAKINLPGNLNLELGYSHFFAGDFIKALLGSGVSDSDWGFIQLKKAF